MSSADNPPSVGCNVETATAQTRQCPNCRAVVPVTTGYVAWCDLCNWNVLPYKKSPPKNKFESLYVDAGKRLGEGLLEEMLKRSSLRSGLTPAKAAAFSVAGVVHSFSLLVILCGILILWAIGFNILNVFPFVFGLTLISLAWVLRPHFPREPKEDIAYRQDFPTLYQVADEISHALGTTRVDMIVLQNDFNAVFSRVGLHRKNVIYLGMALFSLLEPQEKVALLAHEIAHGANGDVTRSFFIGSAVDSLNMWYTVLYPGRIWDRYRGQGGGIVGLLAIPGNLILLGLAQISKGLMLLLVHLLFRDMQRAEYMADHMAAKAAGTEAMLGLLRKLHMSDTVQTTLTRFYLNSSKGNPYDELKRQIDRMPTRELERITRVEKMLASRLDATHPPTAYRIDLLKEREIRWPMVVMGEVNAAAINEELDRAVPQLQAALLNEHFDRMYY